MLSWGVFSHSQYYLISLHTRLDLRDAFSQIHESFSIIKVEFLKYLIVMWLNRFGRRKLLLLLKWQILTCSMIVWSSISSHWWNWLSKSTAWCRLLRKSWLRIILILRCKRHLRWPNWGLTYRWEHLTMVVSKMRIN
jgi:hypothetical protein